MSATLRYGIAVGAIAAATAAGASALRDRVGEAAARGVMAGAALAAAGAVAAILLNDWAFAKDHKVFFTTLGAGLLGRLFVFGGALVYVALRLPGRVDATAMAGALLALYVMFQILEVRLALLRLRGGHG